mgnify:CR=1 FL=1
MRQSSLDSLLDALDGILSLEALELFVERMGLSVLSQCGDNGDRVWAGKIGDAQVEVLLMAQRAGCAHREVSILVTRSGRVEHLQRRALQDG